MNNKKQQTKNAKIGLFSAIMILISAIIGVGIFFKNNSIFNANGQVIDPNTGELKISTNPYGVLISWGLVFIIVISTGFAFVEIISSDKKRSGAGLAGWAHIICGHKIGRFVTVVFALFYFSLKLIDTSFFTSEALFNIFKDPSKPIPQEMWMIALLGIGVMLLFVGINYLSVNIGKGISTVSTFLKFVPLIAGGIVGIYIGSKNGLQGSSFIPVEGKQFQAVNIVGIISCLPALFFAFDSFLIIGNAAKNMVNPEKDIPRSITIAIPTVAILYLIISIGQLFTNEATVYGLFHQLAELIDKGNAAISTAFNTIVGVFIAISLFGVMNAFALTTIRALQNAIDDDDLFGSKWIKKHTNGKKLGGGVIYGFIMAIVYFSLLVVPTLVMNSDAVIDGISNFPSLFFFGIYGLVLLYGYVNHFTGKAPVTKMKSFPYIAIFAIIGCFLSLGFNIFYDYSLRLILDPSSRATLAPWGMFKKGDGVQMWTASVLFFSFFAYFLLLPFVNDGLIKLTGTKKVGQRLIWE